MEQQQQAQQPTEPRRAPRPGALFGVATPGDATPGGGLLVATPVGRAGGFRGARDQQPYGNGGFLAPRGGAHAPEGAAYDPPPGAPAWVRGDVSPPASNRERARYARVAARRVWHGEDPEPSAGMAPGEWGAQMLLRNAARRREDHHVLLYQAALRHEEGVMYAS